MSKGYFTYQWERGETAALKIFEKTVAPQRKRLQGLERLEVSEWDVTCFKGGAVVLSLSFCDYKAQGRNTYALAFKSIFVNQLIDKLQIPANKVYRLNENGEKVCWQEFEQIDKGAEK